MAPKMDFLSYAQTYSLSSIKAIAIFIWLTIFSLNTTAQQVSQQSVGTLSADFVVSALGEATYTMGFGGAPGTAGVAPALSMTYSNQSPAGPLGLGFTLAGISSINRCEATENLDGFVAPVDYSENDRFCMDGERLILVSNGRYGADHTIYHTEHETWTRVVAYGTCGSGPCSFVAHNKDGWQLEYGTVSNAKLTVPGRAEIISWQIYRTLDLHGNYVEVEYQSHPELLQNLPARLLYTGNISTGLTPQRAIVIDYENKPRHVPKYMGGSRFAGDLRISTISTELSGEPIMQYRFDYAESTNSQRSLLTSVQMCSEISGECMAATEFSWQQADNSVLSPNSDTNGQVIDRWCIGDQVITSGGDFNGDGLFDLLCVKDQIAQVLLSTSSEVRSPNNRADGQLTLPPEWCNAQNATISWADFNGDQRIDLLCVDDASSFKVLGSTGSDVASLNSRADGRLTVPVAWCPIEEGCATSWVNFDGDGRTDIACNCNSGEQRVLLSTGSDVISPNSSANGTVATGYCNTSDAHSFWSDFNGDGQSDLFCRDAGRQMVLVSDGQQLRSPNNSANGQLVDNWCATQDATLQTTDFNGDTLYDLACHNPDGTQQVLLSTGTSVASPNSDATGTVRSSWCTTEGRTISWGDFNADGLSDMFCHESSGTQSVLVSNGSSVTSPVSEADGVIRTDWCVSDVIAAATITDFNGDALADLSCHQPELGRSLVLVHSQPFPDLINQIKNGLGGVIQIDYAPMTDAEIYTPGSVVEYPILDVRSPKYLVSSFTKMDGQSAAYRYSYHYTGARTDMERRDWLGFSNIKRTRVADGSYNLTHYIQDYPIVRYVSRDEEFDANDMRLSSGEYIPFVNNPYPNVYQLLTAKETSSTYTNNQPDYVQEKLYEFDQYGNPQLVLDLGNVSTDSDDTFDCWLYDNDVDPWQLGYPREHKVTNTVNACRELINDNSSGWQPATDLSWDKTAYDEYRNPTILSAWDNHNESWLEQIRSYDSYGNATSLTGWNKQTTRMVYEDEYHTFNTEVHSPASSDEMPLVAHFQIDPAFGTFLESIDANGNVRRNVFDGFGRMVEQWGSDPYANNGAATVKLMMKTYAVDSLGQYIETRERLSWEDDQINNWPWIRHYADGMSRPFKTIKSGPVGGENTIMEQRYNDVELPFQTSIPRFVSNNRPDWVTTYYDPMDRETRIVQPDGTVELFEYLQGSLKIQSTMAAGTTAQRESLNENSVRDLIVNTQGQNGGVIEYTYDRLLRTIAVKGANNDQSSIQYDSMDRIVSSSSSDSGSQQLRYNPLGQLEQIIDANGNKTLFTYDALERVKSREFESPDGNSLRYLYFYDEPQYQNGRGNLTRVIGPHSIHEFSYSRYGKVATERVTLAGREFVQRSEYSPSGNVIRVAYPDGAVLITSYDGMGNIHTQSLAEDEGGTPIVIANYTAYTALDQLVHVEYGNAVSSHYEYYPYAESMGRLQSLQSRSAESEVLYAVDYQWNRTGQLVSRNVGASPQTRAQYQYSYNNMGWLVESNGPDGIFDYDYDIAGNIKHKGGVNYEYHPNTNKIATGSNELRAAHDAEGNITELQWPGIDWSMKYNQENHLVAVLKNDQVINQMNYDFNGSRLQRIDQQGNQSLYISADYDILITADRELHTKYVSGPNGRTAAWTKTYPTQARQSDLSKINLRMGSLLFNTADSSGWRQYYWHILMANFALISTLCVMLLVLMGFVYWRLKQLKTNDQTGTQSLLNWVVCAVFILSNLGMPVHAQLQPGNGYPEPGILYFQGDVVDSNVMVTNQSGEISSLVNYFPYGAIDQERSSGPDNFRPKFSSKEYDFGSGLYYFGARYLHAELGRFTQPDPAQQYSSPYTYAGNDPLSMVDPNGREAATGTVVAVLALIGAVIGAYAGGVGANNDFNLAQWNWGSGKTLGDVFAGAAIGAVGGALSGVSAKAGVAAGIAGEIVIGAGEGAAFAMLAGGSPKQVVESSLISGAGAGLLTGAAAGVSRVASQGSRLSHRGSNSALLSPSNTSINSAGVSGSVISSSRHGALAGNRAANKVASTAGAGRRALSPSKGLGSGGGGNATCYSFTEDVKVSTDQGMVAIVDIQPGDQVWGMSSEKDTGLFTVLSNYRRLSQATLTLTLEGETDIETTAEHPFWLPEQGWVTANELAVGDELLSAENRPIVITEIQWHSEPKLVYNFEVAEAHNYFVSDKQVLTHNPSPKNLAGKAVYCMKKLKPYLKDNDARLVLVGTTPTKHGTVGQQLQKQYESTGWMQTLANGKKEVWAQQKLNGPYQWLPFDHSITMGHKESAVSWWNRYGHTTGAQSPEVRAWMNDMNTYQFEHQSVNTAKANLEKGVSYVNPKKPKNKSNLNKNKGK